MLQFANKEIEDGWWIEGKIHPVIRAWNYYLAWACELLYRKNWIITGHTRTREKQIEIYGKFQPSPHCDIPCRAIDVRSKYLTYPEIVALENLFFNHLCPKELDQTAFKYHNVGHGKHIHTHVPLAYIELLGKQRR